MNAQYFVRSIVALTMTSVIAVGCSGGGQSDETPQFQSPTGRTITAPPATNNSVGGNEEGADNQEILDEIMRNREEITAAKASADAAKASSDAAKTAADEAKAKAQEGADNAKKAEKAAKKSGDKAAMAAWVAGIGSALAIATSAIGDRIVYKKGDKNRDETLAQMKKEHDENMGAHSGTQGLAIRNQELLNAATPVIADIRTDQTAQGEQLNTIGRNASSAATNARDANAGVRQALTNQASDREALLAQITTLETRLAAMESNSTQAGEQLAALNAHLASLKTIVESMNLQDQELAKKVTDQLALFKQSLDEALASARTDQVAQGMDVMGPPAPDAAPAVEEENAENVDQRSVAAGS